MIIDIPANTWIDLYTATGIPVGTSLLLNTYSGNINVSDSATKPTLESTDVYPLHCTRPTILSSGAPGSWARSLSNAQNASISVEINPF